MSIVNIPFINTNTFGIELESLIKTEVKQEKFVFIIDISGSIGETIKNSRYSKKEYITKVFKSPSPIQTNNDDFNELLDNE